MSIDHGWVRSKEWETAEPKFADEFPQ